MSIAWHIAAFGRAKKFPRHQEIIEQPKRPANAMRPDQLQSAVATWLSSRKKR